MKITTEWSKPISVKYGKDIVIKLSEEYFLVSILITGDGDARFERTILGRSENVIHAYVISYIRNPMISVRTLFEENMTVKIELKEP